MQKRTFLFLSALERMRRPSCMPLSSFLLLTICICMRACSFDMYDNIMVRSDMIKNKPNMVVNLIITDARVNSSKKITGSTMKEKKARLRQVKTI